MIIYGIKNCDTMKKAFTWLEENGVAYTFHDYKLKGISKEKISQWLKHQPMDVLINAKSTTFKELPDAQKAGVKNVNKAIDLMINNTSIIKRPIVETGHEILVGFKPEFWDDHV
jgi:arsenate reductase